jgi:hypothetical protein
VVAALAASPRDAVLFALLTLREVQLAWNLAYSLGLDSDDVWERLATAYEKVDPRAVLPILARLVDNELTEAGAQHYRIAARRLAKMRKLATGSAEAAGVDELMPSSARRTAVGHGSSRSSIAPACPDKTDCERIELHAAG